MSFFCFCVLKMNANKTCLIAIINPASKLFMETLCQWFRRNGSLTLSKQITDLSAMHYILHVLNQFYMSFKVSIKKGEILIVLFLQLKYCDSIRSKVQVWVPTFFMYAFRKGDGFLKSVHFVCLWKCIKLWMILGVKLIFNILEN